MCIRMERSANARVLVVDDEQELASLYADQLADDYHVDTVYGAWSALETVDETVDVILLDRRMPEASGEDLLDEFRERAPDARIVMVTAVVPDFDIIDMDVDDYLLKPVTREELRTTVEGMLIRSTYQELVQEYFTLTSKYAALRTYKSDAALAESDAFAELEASLEQVRSELDSIVGQFSSEDFQAMYRDLS